MRRIWQLPRNIPNSRRLEKCYDFASCKTWQPRSRPLKLRRCPSDIFRRASSYLFSFSVRSGSSCAGNSAANGRSTNNTTMAGSFLFLLVYLFWLRWQDRPRAGDHVSSPQVSSQKSILHCALPSAFLRSFSFCRSVFLKLRTRSGDRSAGSTPPRS